MESAFCWQCKCDVVMLDEDEWSCIEPLLRQGVASIKSYRAEYGVELSEVPLRVVYADALRKHEEITGQADIRPQDIWHHRRADHGPLCSGCSKPLRTPTAQQCAACGLRRRAV